MTREQRVALKAAIDKKRREQVNLDCNNASISLYWSGCRCNACRKAEADYRRQLRHDVGRVRTHGKSGYSYGCRCEECKAGYSGYRAAYQRRKKQAA